MSQLISIMNDNEYYQTKERLGYITQALNGIKYLHENNIVIVSLFYVVLNLLGLSFLEKGGKALLLGSVFPVRCQTSFYKHLMT